MSDNTAAPDALSELQAARHDAAIALQRSKDALVQVDRYRPADATAKRMAHTAWQEADRRYLAACRALRVHMELQQSRFPSFPDGLTMEQLVEEVVGRMQQ